MIFLKELSNLITVVLMGTLIFFVLADNILIFLVKTHKPLIDNKYFGFHRKHGFLKTTLLKLLVALFIVYALIEPTGKSGALAAMIWAHGFFVTKLLFDFIKKDGKQNQKENNSSA